MSDIVSTVEAAYDLSADEPSWLEHIANSARPWLDAGHGVIAYHFDASPMLEVKIGPVALSGARPSHATVPSAAAAELGAMNAEAYRRAGACSTVSDAFEGTVPFDWKRFYPPGVHDFIALFGRTPDHRGVVLGAPLAAVTTVGRRRTTLSCVAVHLGAAFRIREMLGSERSALLEASSMEAVLTPTGQCLEARRNATSRTAREELREMARAVDRARGKLRRSDPDEALALWRGLVSGRWSLVDHFDSDGRRFVVALRNDPTVTDPRALTLRERQVAYFASLGYTNKLIAYALGVSSASVSLHLKEAAHKLRVTSRTDLAAFFAPFEGDEASVLPTTRLSE